MATTFTTNLGMPVPAIADRNWGNPLLALFNLLDVSMLGPLAMDHGFTIPVDPC